MWRTTRDLLERAGGEETYCDDEISARNILTTEFDFDDVIAGVVRRVEDVECSIFVVDDIDIQIVAHRRANSTGDGTRTGLVRIDGNRVFFSDLKVRIRSIARNVTFRRITDRLHFDVEWRIVHRNTSIVHIDVVSADIVRLVGHFVSSILVVDDFRWNEKTFGILRRERTNAVEFLLSENIDSP